MPSESLRSCSRLSTTACTETSSAAVGSSRMTRSGLSAIARAMPTRAFWPPESWCGKRSSRSTGRPTWRASSSQRARTASRPLHVAEPQDRIGDRARGGEARIEAVGRVLEHHLDALAQRQPGELLGRDRADVLAVEHDRAVGLVDQPHDHGRGGRLAAAGFADQADALAAVDREADAVDGAEHLGLRRAALRLNSLRAARRPTPLRGYSLTSFSTTSSGVVGCAVALGDRRAARRGGARRPRAADRAASTPGRGVARISLRV